MNIHLQNLTKVYGSGASAAVAVENVSMDIRSGELFFLLGPSGCGKTTLLRLIAGLVEPTAGEVFFAGRNVTREPVEKRNTAMVFQNYALWPHMTVAENVLFGPKMRGVPRQERRARCEAQLARVHMEQFARRKPNQLSGGQQQRVSLARALAAEADYLLLDEPLSNLDARLRLEMRGELRRLIKASQTTAVYVTHDQSEALSMADRVAVMDEGRIVQIAPPEQLYNHPATRFVADFLGEANFIDGRIVREAERALVETSVGPISAAGCEDTPAGTSVTCCVRPERIRLAWPGQPTAEGENALSATVESSIYLGDIRQTICSLGDGTVWKVSTLGDAGADFQIGRDVTLCFAAQDVSVLTA